ncbi:hypothetical protein NMG60_11014921 [Bertholletia excelsa]
MQRKRKGGSEEVEAGQTGRVVRSTGRKDRHSKVSTAKGPRDRRVRLSAATAIRFYDVQERLGCGRPSEAIDWLMKEAKAAIDALGDPEPPGSVPDVEDGGPVQAHQEQGVQSQQRLEEEPVHSLSNFLQDDLISPRSRSQIHSFCFFQELMLLQHHLGTDQPALFSTSDNAELREEIFGQNQMSSQGGTLQSSYLSPSNYFSCQNEMDPAAITPPPSGAVNLFASEEFPGFCVSPGVRGEGDKHNPELNRPSLAASLLHDQD